MVEINDSHILMYLDGVVDAETKSRIENEEVFHKRAQELDNRQKAWVRRMYRSTCPDPQTLGEYHLDLISSKERKSIEKHLSTCIYCPQELQALIAFVEPGPIERLIARLVGGGKPRGLMGARSRLAVGTRGGESGAYQYEAGDTRIVLDTMEDGENPGYQALVGIISGVEPKNYEVTLWLEGERVGSAKVDDEGGFAIGKIQSGEYQLIILGPKVEIQVQSFMI